MLETAPDLKVVAKGDSLWRGLTKARANGTVPRDGVALQRAAATKAHQAFAQREAELTAKLERALAEQDEEVTARALPRIAREPKAPAEYRRSHRSKQGRRQAVALLEGARVTGDGRTDKVSGAGTFTVATEVPRPIRSCQLVERRGRRRLHAQHGQELPPPKALTRPC